MSLRDCDSTQSQSCFVRVTSSPASPSKRDGIDFPVERVVRVLRDDVAVFVDLSRLGKHRLGLAVVPVSVGV
jgi:hypothetical protein